MTKQDILDQVMQTTYNDWTHLWEKGEHTLNENLDIQIIQANYNSPDEFKEPWAMKFPDNLATKGIFQIFYKKAYIDTFYLVCVDGGRANMPMPVRAGETKISRRDYRLGKTMDESGRMDEYIESAGFTVID